MSNLINNNTPIEKYTVKGEMVFVKREDLSTNLPLPPLAKMRGLYMALSLLSKDRLVGVFDTKVSIASYGAAIICREIGFMKCVACFARKKKDGIPNNILLAQRAGAELLEVPAGRTPICWYKARETIERRGGYMLPQGLASHYTTMEVAKEAATVPEELLKGSLVISTGTGTILSGVIKGLQRLPMIYGISACISPKKQKRNIVRLLNQAGILDLFNTRLVEWQSRTQLLSPIMDYYEECEVDVPFPANRHYDAKAWKWLVDNISVKGLLPRPILFWNIGANYNHLWKELDA